MMRTTAERGSAHGKQRSASNASQFARVFAERSAIESSVVLSTRLLKEQRSRPGGGSDEAKAERAQAEAAEAAEKARIEALAAKWL